MAKRKAEVLEAEVLEPVVSETPEETVSVEPKKVFVAGHEVLRSTEKVVMGKTYTEVLLDDGSTQLI